MRSSEDAGRCVADEVEEWAVRQCQPLQCLGRPFSLPHSAVMAVGATGGAGGVQHWNGIAYRWNAGWTDEQTNLGMDDYGLADEDTELDSG